MSGKHVPGIDPDLLVIARPKASKASRPIQMRSTASFRGCRVSGADDREVFRESTLEDGLALIFDTNRSVEKTEDQPPPVSFLDDDGRYHRHFFDFRVTLRCGTRVAYAVKAWRRVEPTRIRRKLELIEQQVGSRFADEYLLVTERDLPRSRVFNATLISHARLVRDERQVAELASFTARLRGAIPISKLLEASGLGVDAFVSAVCLLDDGVLAQASPGRIGLETVVRTVLHDS